jgi:hypothetical protein
MDDAQFDEVRHLLRLLDVDDNCLVPLPDGSRYTALSYLWGQEKRPFKATKRNIPAISKINGLAPYIGKLPLVIPNAIIFMESIGERYLWVDRLCVVQDDPAEKDRIIPSLHILAVVGSKESAGLTRIRTSLTPRAQIMADIAPDLTLLMPHNLEAMLYSP